MVLQRSQSMMSPDAGVRSLEELVAALKVVVKVDGRIIVACCPAGRCSWQPRRSCCCSALRSRIVRFLGRPSLVFHHGQNPRAWPWRQGTRFLSSAACVAFFCSLRTSGGGRLTEMKIDRGQARFSNWTSLTEWWTSCCGST